MARRVIQPTHRAVLEDGEVIEFQGAHPTHWTTGGVNPDTGKRSRKHGPVVSRRVTHIMPGATPENEGELDRSAEEAEPDEDEEDDD